MPWEEIDIVKRRKEFIDHYLTGDYRFKGLCISYGISRKTGYKWVGRFMSGGYNNLTDRSSAPKHIAHRTADEVSQLIITTKLNHQNWGPKKILDYLRRHEPQVPLPADSTAGEILKKAGLVKPRKVRRRVPADEHPFGDCEQSNQVWSVDYKGQFKLGNGKLCYPLTITDNHSRYLLQCRALTSTCYQDARDWMEWTFREYGLPEAMRSDNGSPFASIAAGGISRLSMWWIQLGIRPQRIKPGCPQQNGRHERMHRTLKEAVINPSAYSAPRQQKRFDEFIAEYNHERSHEGLDRQCPDAVYEYSSRSYPERIPEIEYDEGKVIRRVKRSGEIQWQNQRIYISQVISGQAVSLEEIDNGVWEVCYGFYRLGTLTDKERQLVRATLWHRKES